MSLNQRRIIDLPKVHDPRGNLTFIEGGTHIPFKIKRVFYLYDVPGGESRGGHSNIKTHQFLVAVSGSFDVITSDGQSRNTFTLNRSYYGLYIPPMIWREIENFSSGAVCLVLASEKYSNSDYIRDWDTYINARESGD